MSGSPLRSGKKRRRESMRPVDVVLTGLLVIAVTGALSALALRSPRGLPGLGYTTYHSSIPDTGNMRIHSEIRLNGVRIGEVTEIKVVDGKSKLRLKIDRGQEFPRDSKVAVRGKGLLGARYLALFPGNSKDNAEDGDTLGVASNNLTLSVSDALDTFDPATRKGLHDVLGELGRGFVGRGQQLNNFLRISPPGSRAFRSFTAAVFARTGAVARFVPSTASASAALDAAKDDFAAMFQPTTTALQPFVDRREAVRAILDEAPPTFDALRPAFVEGRALLTSVGGLARALNRTLEPAKPNLQVLDVVLTSGSEAMEDGIAIIREAKGLSGALTGIGRALRPTLTPLRRGFGYLIPLTKVLSIRRCDAVNFAENWHSLLGQGVPGGTLIGPIHGLRVQAYGGADSLGGFLPAELADQYSGKAEFFSPPCKYSVPEPVYGPGTVAPLPTPAAVGGAAKTEAIPPPPAVKVTRGANG